MKAPKASLYQVKHYSSKENPGSYPVSIQFYFDRKRVFVSTGINLTPEDFETITQGSPRAYELKQIKSELKEQLYKAESIIKELKSNFSLKRAKRLFLDSSYSVDKNSIYTGFDSYIRQLEENGQVKTAESY